MSEMMMRKMQVPAYCPVFVGVQVMENRGVLVDVKKVMAMSFIPIMDMEVDEAVVMDEVVDMGMLVDVDMAVMLLVIDISMILPRRWRLDGC